MAKAPMRAAAAPAAPPPGDMGDAADMGAADDAGADTDAGGEGEDQGDDVLLTVLKDADGTYRLIEGDEDETGAGGDAEEAGKAYDSPGALLKAILDILNEDQSSAGGEGSADDQFQAGYDESAPPAPAAPMAQKY